jgi:hypothetical protein
MEALNAVMVSTTFISTMILARWAFLAPQSIMMIETNINKATINKLSISEMSIRKMSIRKMSIDTMSISTIRNRHLSKSLSSSQDQH